jgi:outer membrane protein OmpA-like peptidoglycan-associated protein
MLASSVVLLAVFLSVRVESQEAVEVRDLTDAELTEEQLIEILKPSEAPPEPLIARGLSIPTKRLQCKPYRDQMTRGISTPPASAAVAIRVFFAVNSAELLPEATRNLEMLGRALSSDKLKHSCLRLEGHTDDTGSAAYNDRLSLLRAQAVVRFLTTRFGLEPERLLSVGYGERKPMADNRTETGRSKNRRVQVVNLGYGQ